MQEAKIHFHAKGQLIALVGNPNCGKTALFNRMTGGRQHVANYAGVTVERKEGRIQTPNGKNLRLLDLPGTYSLYPRSPDEKVTCDVLAGTAIGEKKPDLVICVVDATNLRRSLRLVLAVQRSGIPCMVAINMMDEAIARGLNIDLEGLSKELGIPVTSTIAIKANGDAKLKALLDDTSIWQQHSNPIDQEFDSSNSQIEADHTRVQHILHQLALDKVSPDTRSDNLDKVLLHPVFGPLILVLLLFFIFQAMFSWASVPMDLIKEGNQGLKEILVNFIPAGWLQSLLIDGVIAGTFGVITFLPQILILFLFILILEESGYLPRAAYLLDRLMGSVGLSGRSFIPLLSSFACAIPGILAMRTIPNARDRRVTMLIAPLMTCSARLPVYSLLIAAFIPEMKIWGVLELQGLIMFALYALGILGALLIAWILKRFTSAGRQVRPLMMELPRYRIPNPSNILLGLWQRAILFLKRVGGTIFILTIVVWFLASFPEAPVGATMAPIEYSFAGMFGKAIAVVLAPIGFNWQISIALIPGLAAREVVISALGTVYAISSSTNVAVADSLAPIISQQWSLPTALSLLTWFVFAPQCLSTLATLKRESGGWKLPLISASYLFAMAYIASFIVYRLASFILG